MEKADMDNVIALAKEFVCASTREADDSGAGASIDVDDEHANIVDGSGSSEEDDNMSCDEDE
jgi:hypothetical protein